MLAITVNHRMVCHFNAITPVITPANDNSVFGKTNWRERAIFEETKWRGDFFRKAIGGENFAGQPVDFDGLYPGLSR